MRLKVLNTVPANTTTSLQHRIETVSSISDVNELISDINQMLQTKFPMNSDEKILLTSIRQKAYDKKKKIIASEVQKVEEIPSESTHPLRRFLVPELYIFGWLAIITAIFLYLQTVPLYQSIGFPYARSCAIGSLIMIFGFSLMHSITRSKLLLILCVYISVYEVGLIVAGSVRNEVELLSDASKLDPELLLLTTQSDRMKESYESIREKYDNPLEKTFQNSWYKEKFVNPAFEKMQASQKEVIARQKSMDNEGVPIIGMLLKIFFRLGIVLLCMVSVHYFLIFAKKEII